MPPHRTPIHRTPTAIAVGDQNVTDRHPTRSIDDIAHFGNLSYDVLSPIGFDGAFWYARLRHRFRATAVEPAGAGSSCRHRPLRRTA